MSTVPFCCVFFPAGSAGAIRTNGTYQAANVILERVELEIGRTVDISHISESFI